MGDHAAETMQDKIMTTPWIRTLWQGFIADALVAIGAGGLTLLTTGDITSPIFWSAMGVLVGKSFLTALMSWWTRLKVKETLND
jgi:hypothetical protein